MSSPPPTLDDDAELIYETYRLAMNCPAFMPVYEKQESQVKLAWRCAIANSLEKTTFPSGESLYEGYFDAVGGVALKNNRVKLSKFEAMDNLRQNAWNIAASKLSIA